MERKPKSEPETALQKMSLKPDSWIREQALRHRMIEPFSEHRGGSGILSYGLSSYGYDIRLAQEFRIFSGTRDNEIDPKNFDVSLMTSFTGKVCIIPPNSFVLGQSLEYFRIPRKILTICFGKSSYARNGVVVNVTPFEPGWEGHATLSISNTTPAPVRLYAEEGIAQILFLEGEGNCLTSYADRKGRYQKTRTIAYSKS